MTYYDQMLSQCIRSIERNDLCSYLKVLDAFSPIPPHTKDVVSQMIADDVRKELEELPHRFLTDALGRTPKKRRRT